jgi:hypothetical protein
MKTNNLLKTMVTVIFTVLVTHATWSQYQMEKLNRGVVATRSGTNNFISWRFLGTEDDGVTFNLYRGTTKVNGSPLNVTNYTDAGAAANSQYSVRAVVAGVEQAPSETVSVWGQQYLSIPLQIPPRGTTPSGESYTYSAGDCSVGDVDGDGVYEIFLKWDPSNQKDNSQAGYTGNVFIDCYKINGTRLWRIDLGRNIRAGAHYTQFQVYDFDGDGKAELMVKTSDGTRDGVGTVIGNASADYRNSSGYILTGNEFLTVFNGLTGAAMKTVNYLPGRGNVGAWGDTYGNRVDRFNAGVAYLDGKKPSAVFCRGYYTRLTVATWDWNGTNLTNRWLFDSGNSSSNPFYGQGNHSISIADVDSDGKQEIITGAAVIDDNGVGLYSTGFGHGDAGHVSDFDPTNPGLEVFNIQERNDDDDCYLYSPSQKRVIWKKGTTGGEGPGRGVMANITDQFAGAEAWVAGGQTSGGPWRINGSSMGTGQPSSVNFLTWWDGDLPRELNNATTIDKYGTGRIFTASGTSSNNGTKTSPCLSGDILGDWREELILRASDNSALRIYTTTIPTTYKIRTLLHDAQYRVALAWQNSSYNQPPHPSFYLGAGVPLPAKPNITIVGENSTNIAPTVSITAPVNNASFVAPATITIAATAADTDGTISNVQFFNGATLIGTDATSPYSMAWTNVAAGTYSITAKATDNAGAVTTSSVVLVTVTTAPGATSVVQAETACSVVGILNESTNTGFNGTGYVNTSNQIGSTAAYSINSIIAQTVNLNLRYANAGTTGRNVSVAVNGMTQVADVAFPSTAAWTSWSTVSVPLSLSAGQNTILFTSLTADGGPNLDELVFNVADITSDTCTVEPPVNQLPITSITAPANNSSFTAPVSLSITASATDADGTISSVQFFNGTTLIGTDATAPYAISWTNVSAGTYSITAKATDNAGGVSSSAAVSITVNTVTPPTGDIIGANCGTKNTTATFELSAANKANATSVSWWFTGSSQSLTPVSGDPSKVVINYGNSFTGGDLCAGVNYSVSPWFKQYCKAITLCSAKMDDSFAEELSEVQTATVAPNPSTGSFMITSPEDISSFKVIDNLGVTIHSENVLEAGGSITFGEQLASGLYVVYIRYASGREEIKRVQKIK